VKDKQKNNNSRGEGELQAVFQLLIVHSGRRGTSLDFVINRIDESRDQSENRRESAENNGLNDYKTKGEGR
jgi:hypothetical protein